MDGETLTGAKNIMKRLPMENTVTEHVIPSVRADRQVLVRAIPRTIAQNHVPIKNVSLLSLEERGEPPTVAIHGAEQDTRIRPAACYSEEPG